MDWNNSEEQQSGRRRKFVINCLEIENRILHIQHCIIMQSSCELKWFVEGGVVAWFVDIRGLHVASMSS